MSDDISISVVICTYNGESFIGEQIESILEQTLLPKEIVIGDDGSSDCTIQKIEGLKEKIESKGISLRIFHNSHLGAHGNFKETLPKATCEFIAPCDQDDIWLPGKLEACYNALINKNAELAYCNDIIRYENGKELYMNIQMPSILDHLWGSLIAGHLILVKKQLLDVYKVAPTISFDYGLSLVAVCHNAITKTHDAYCIWRRHKNVVTTEYSNHNKHPMEKMGKWKKFCKALYLSLNKNSSSEVVRERMTDIGIIIRAYAPNDLFYTNVIRVTDLLSKQTFASILESGYVYQKLKSNKSSVYAKYSYKNKFLARLYWFTYPACWWYDYRKYDSL